VGKISCLVRRVVSYCWRSGTVSQFVGQTWLRAIDAAKFAIYMLRTKSWIASGRVTDYDRLRLDEAGKLPGEGLRRGRESPKLELIVFRRRVTVRTSRRD